MTFNDFDPLAQKGWANLGLTFGSLGGYPNATSGGLAGQINAFRDTGIPSAL